MIEAEHNNNAKEKLMVLLAEDNKINQKIVQIMVAKMGHNLVVANDGSAAVDYFQKNTFDLIFMDIHMPVMDGIAATKKIREIEAANGVQKPIPIIALSAHMQEKSDPKMSTLGFDGFIEKPFTAEKIESALKHRHC
jgi:CheY-like chemotaxis protein